MLGLAMIVLSAVHEFVAALATRWVTLNSLIESHVGVPGKLAVWAVLALAAFVVIGHAAKMAFNLIRYVFLPSAAIAVALLLLVPGWSPMTTFPVLLGASTLNLMARALR